MIFRRSDWSTRLQRWAAEEQGKPFAWGTTDCAAMARAALIEMFGAELIVHLPQWNNARGAALILQVRDGIGTILEELGAERTTVPFMRVGDVVLCAEPKEPVGGAAVMVCIEGQKCVAGTREGVVIMIPPPESVVYSLWQVSFNG